MEYIGRRGLLAGAAGALGVAATAGAAGAAAATERAGAAGRAGTAERAATAEFRGMWIASVQNVDWPSRAGLSAAEQRSGLISLLDTAVRRRLRTR